MNAPMPPVDGESMAERLASARSQVAGLERELAEVLGSPTWRMAERLQRLEVELARSRPGRLAHLALRSARVLISEGWRGVGARMAPRFRWPRRITVRRTLPRRWAPLTVPAMSDPGGVSIVIPVFNQAPDTYRCLQALIAHTPAGQYEVIVVDNASTDETSKVLAHVQGLRVLTNSTNLGVVDANNQGAAEARGEFLLFLNNDTRVRDGWLPAMLQTLTADPMVGAVGAQLIYPDGRLQEAGAIVWNDGTGRNYGRGDNPELPQYQYQRPVDYCSGACLLVRRSLFEQLGGFDRQFAPAYYEDVDLCFGLRQLGYQVVYQPKARVIHVEGATAGTDPASGFKRFQEINRSTFQKKHAEVLRQQQPDRAGHTFLARDRRRGRRILVIDHMVPRFDHDAGSMRIMAMLRILSELGHAVTFLPDYLDAVEPYTEVLQQLGVEVLYGSFSIADYLAEHLGDFDLAILCRARIAIKHQASILAHRNRPPIVFDTVDLHYLREQRLAELMKDAVVMHTAALMKRTELHLARASDMVWVTSPYEVEVLRKENDALRVEVIPLVDTVRATTAGFEDRRDLVFVGGCLHPPNEDAVLHFVNRILPLIRTRLPAARFLVVGPHPSLAVRALASDSIVVTGHVKDLAAVLDRARVMVAPLRYGAGLKGKITHSLANGLPVVTTSVGAEGMLVEDRTHLLIADSEQAFAERVVELYEDAHLWARLSKAGAAHVDTHFGYETVKRKLDAVVRELASC
jgi:GT2 family glycosyltransferase